MHVYATSTPYPINASATRTAAVRERNVLAEHLHHCNGMRGRLFALYCAAELLNVFLLPRIVTLVVVSSMLLGAGAWAL